MNHARIKTFHERLDIIGNIGGVRNIVIIDLRKKIFAYQSFYHVVRRADDIILSSIVLYHRIHFLIGVKQVYDHVIPRFFLKLILQLRIEIIAETVYIKGAFFTGGISAVLSASGQERQRHDHRQQQRCDLFHLFFSSLLLLMILTTISIISTATNMTVDNA